MPNRNVEGNYRYKYQGQEKDPETGKEAFQLRLWDSRIGRWLTTDPYGQYSSPYLGMSNNPIIRVDPDGGFDWFYDSEGNLQYDERVKSQADVDRLYGRGEWSILSGGIYNAEYFFEGNLFYHSNGLVSNLETGERWSFNEPSINVLNSPVGDATVNSQFLAQRNCNNCSRTHGGTDYRVPIGTPVNATASGTVARSYFSGTYGNTVIINHGASNLGDNSNVYTLYAHGSSRLVQDDENVNVGQTILSSGNTGRKTTGPHLHYEVIVTHLQPHQQSFFRNLSIRRAPTELGGLLNN